MSITVGDTSIDAAIAAVVKQRNDALDNIAMLAAEFAVVTAQNDKLKKELADKNNECELLRSELGIFKHADAVDESLVEATNISHDE